MNNEQEKKDYFERTGIDLDKESDSISASVRGDNESKIPLTIFGGSSKGDLVANSGLAGLLITFVKNHGSVTATLKSITATAKLVTFYGIHFLGIGLMVVGVAGLLYYGTKEIVIRINGKRIPYTHKD